MQLAVVVDIVQQRTEALQCPGRGYEDVDQATWGGGTWRGEGCNHLQRPQAEVEDAFALEQRGQRYLPKKGNAEEWCGEDGCAMWAWRHARMRRTSVKLVALGAKTPSLGVSW